jgi:ribosome biogenesis GTPase A
MEIQWFPGHMNRTIREIKENINKVDVVIEILDSRVPYSSSNPVISEIIEDKPRLIVLNKSDLCDPLVTEKWIEYYKQIPNTNVIEVSSKTFFNLNKISDFCISLCKNEKWFYRREVRGMIVGIPNVGKSTIINALSKKSKVITGNMPGVTRNMTRITVSDKFQLYDTPGVLWHKFDDETSGINLAALGSIKESILDLYSITLRILEYLLKKYPNLIKDRYNIIEEYKNLDDLILAIGKKRGCLLPGGIVDIDKAVSIILKELKEGRIGLISLEEPEDLMLRQELVNFKKLEKEQKIKERELKKNNKGKKK